MNDESREGLSFNRWHRCCCGIDSWVDLTGRRSDDAQRASAGALRAAMRRTAPCRHVLIGLLVGLVSVLGSGQALDEEPSGLPVAPELASPRFELTEEKTLTTAGITLYVAGALYDLYTTKRAMDYGLHEGNPFLNGSGNPDRTLATAAVAKVGFAFLIGRLERRRGDRVRGTWFLSCGALQLGLGIANRRATLRERSMAYVAPVPQPSPPSTTSEPAASRRSRIDK
jgi:hypothetical protein